MTNYNELIGRHLVYVSFRKGDKPGIITSVDGIIEEVDTQTININVFLRVHGRWAACISRSDIDTALTATGKEIFLETYYIYLKIV